MEITIEAAIGEQKDVISEEFSTFSRILASLGIEGNVKQVIIPNSIEETIRKIEGDPSFKTDRGHQNVIAKVLHSADGAIMLFSPLLFLPNIAQIRWLMYLHEIMHIFTKTVFPPIQTESPSFHWYLTNLYILYDEYYANRKSLEMTECMFTEKTDPYKQHLRGFVGHIKTLRNQEIYYNPLRNEISQYSQHGDIRSFLREIEPIWDKATKDIVYSYAFMDYKERNRRLEKFLFGSSFVNARTTALIDFFRLKYKNVDFDLHGGIEIMKSFTLNFGMAWEDMDNGFYNCYVHRI